MAEELQSLIEKINRDGVEKAEAEAQAIIAGAKAKAAGIVAEAKQEAEKSAEAAKAEAALAAERAAETIRQAARDAVVSVERSVMRIFEKVLAENVDAALADPAQSAAIVAAAIKDVAGEGEVLAGAKIAEVLKSQLAAKGGFTVVLDESARSGFKVVLDGGRVEHDFTGAAISAELSKRLRPDLAKLVSEA